MNVLIRGDLPWCVGAVSVGAVVPGRAVLTGQRSAEVVVPAGLWLLGRTERWELTGGSSRTRDCRDDRSQPAWRGRPMWRYW